MLLAAKSGHKLTTYWLCGSWNPKLISTSTNIAHDPEPLRSISYPHNPKCHRNTFSKNVPKSAIRKFFKLKPWIYSLLLLLHVRVQLRFWTSVSLVYRQVTQKLYRYEVFTNFLPVLLFRSDIKLIVLFPTNTSYQKSHSSESITSWADQERSWHLWSQKFHRRYPKGLQLVPVQRQICPARVLIVLFTFILILSSSLRLILNVAFYV
jgi:hypothetical protein